MLAHIGCNGKIMVFSPFSHIIIHPRVTNDNAPFDL